MKVEYQIIKRKDNFCIDEYQFICLLETNKNYKINKEKKIIKYKNIDIKYIVETILNNNNEEVIFMICFSIDDEKNLEDFEKFDKSFIDFVTRFNDKINLNRLWDDISKKYAEEMYPKIFYIENLLRKIIYYFMGKNVGNKWTVECFPKEVENSIKNVKLKNKSENNENILYYADFIQLSLFLFNKYPNEEISQKDLIEKLREKDLNIKELINKYEFKSNWDRYFEPIVNKEDLENNLNELYNYRNLVAHNRLIREKDKNRSEELITRIEKVFKECLTKINKINVPEEDKENLENMSSIILSPITNNLNNLGYTSLIDSMKGLSGFNLGLASSLDSMKGLSGFDLGTTSLIDSAKGLSGFDLGTTSLIDSVKGLSGFNLGLASSLDSMKGLSGFDLGTTSLIDSVKGFSGFDLGTTSLIDSVKGLSGFNLGLASSLDSMKGLSGINLGTTSLIDSSKRISGFDLETTSTTNTKKDSKKKDNK